MASPDDSSPALTAWRAGFVRRWHANPDMAHLDDLNAAHQGRCAVLALKLFPSWVNFGLLVACVTHDLGESVVGDLPYTRRDRSFAAALDEAESVVLADMGFPEKDQLPPLQARRLKFVDRLDAYLFARHRAPHVLTGDGWPEQHDWLVSGWHDLGAEGRWRDVLGSRPLAEARP